MTLELPVAKMSGAALSWLANKRGDAVTTISGSEPVPPCSTKAACKASAGTPVATNKVNTFEPAQGYAGLRADIPAPRSWKASLSICARKCACRTTPRVATRRQSFRRPNMISMLRRLYAAYRI